MPDLNNAEGILSSQQEFVMNFSHWLDIHKLNFNYLWKAKLFYVSWLTDKCSNTINRKKLSPHFTRV